MCWMLQWKQLILKKVSRLMSSAMLWPTRELIYVAGICFWVFSVPPHPRYDSTDNFSICNIFLKLLSKFVDFLFRWDPNTRVTFTNRDCCPLYWPIFSNWCQVSGHILHRCFPIPSYLIQKVIWSSHHWLRPPWPTHSVVERSYCFYRLSPSFFLSSRHFGFQVWLKKYITYQDNIFRKCRYVF